MNSHPFFEEITHYPELAGCCNLKIQELPEAYEGTAEMKAILLGADPTNNGIKEDKGQKQLKTVFGIGEFTEFFRPQLGNLKQIGLDVNNVYIQNLCRNYFNHETSKNKCWGKGLDCGSNTLKKNLTH